MGYFDRYHFYPVNQIKRNETECGENEIEVWKNK